MIEVVEWQDEFGTGIEALDLEHQRLIHERNDLVVMLQTRQLSIEIFLKSYIDLAISHIDAEEQFLEANDYSGLEQTRKEHQALADDLMRLQARFGELNPEEQQGELMSVFGDFQQHMIKEVEEFHEFFGKRLFIEDYPAEKRS